MKLGQKLFFVIMIEPSSEVLAAAKMNDTIYFSLFFAKQDFTLKNQKKITTISLVK